MVLMKLRHTSISLFLLAFSCTFSAQAEDNPQPPSFRLPATAAPVRYKVNLTVAPDKDTFTGTVDIAISLKEATSVLWLNADKLNIKQATLDFGGHSMAVRVITEPKDLAGFAFERTVGPGPAKLHVEYEGQVSRKDMSGIFQLKEGDNWYIYSQFENISARRAFPCFDEPGFKIPWQLTLVVPAGEQALANTAVTGRQRSGDGKRSVVSFAETRPLPSYLVAFVVGPFDVVPAGIAGGG